MRKPVGGIGHLDVVAARERLHVLVFHGGEAREQLLQHRVGDPLGGALVESLAAELDLEGDADSVQARLVGRPGRSSISSAPPQCGHMP